MIIKIHKTRNRMELPQPEKQNEDSTFNNISNGERLNIFPKIVNKPSMSIKLFLSILFNIVLEIPVSATSNSNSKEVQTEMEEATLSLFVDGIFVYTENLKESMKKCYIK